MKVLTEYKTIGFALVLGALTFACNQETVDNAGEGVDAAQMEVREEAIEARRDFKEFEAWVQDNLRRAETATKEEWAEIKSEYQRREAQVEEQSANWDEETRQEWEELKAEWNEAENRVRERLGNIEDVDVERRNN